MTEVRKIDGETLFREMRLDASGVDAEARTVPAALSSEIEVQRWFGREVLSHSPDAINLERAADGVPLLWSHDPEKPIGRVRDVRLDRDGKLRGVLHFSKNERATEIWQDVRDGFLTDISIGYRIDKWEEEKGSDKVTATRWTLLESSVVTVPADHTVGINRAQPENRGVTTMTETTTAAPEAAPGTRATEVAGSMKLIQNQATEAGIRQERDRVSGIRNLFVLDAFRTAEHLALCDRAIDEGWSVDAAKDALLEFVGKGITPIARSAPQQSQAVNLGRGPIGGRVEQGRDEMTGFREGALESLLIRSGIEKDKEVIAKARTSEFSGMSLTELAREYLRRSGTETRGMGKMQIVGAALTRSGFMVGHTVSDFASILVDAANKSLLTGYEEAPETWSIWTKAVALNDFKAHNRLIMSSFGDLDVVPEGGEYKYGTFSDAKETLTLKTYGKLFSITRQAIINDDTRAFTEIPRHMGRAASRMVGDEVYAITSGAGPTLAQDNIALFHASSHGGNLITSGAAPSVSTLNTGFKVMGLQTDLAGNVLNLSPKYLICGKTLEATARDLVVNQYDPAGTAGTLKGNPYYQRLTLVVDARLDAIASGAPWFLFADQNQFPTVEVGFLDGNQAPYLEQMDSFTVDGVGFKVRLDCIAGAMAYQGAFQNDGA